MTAPNRSSLTTTKCPRRRVLVSIFPRWKPYSCRGPGEIGHWGCGSWDIVTTEHRGIEDSVFGRVSGRETRLLVRIRCKHEVDTTLNLTINCAQKATKTQTNDRASAISQPTTWLFHPLTTVRTQRPTCWGANERGSTTLRGKVCLRAEAPNSACPSKEGRHPTRAGVPC